MLRCINIVNFLHKEKLDLIFSGNVFRKSDNLLKVRLWIYCLALIHLAVVSSKLLFIDFTKAEDPSLWVYESVRWKLITCWFNLLSFIYLPVCIYCEVKELLGENGEPQVKWLNNFRFLIFTSILLPTTTFADILFWRLWMKDRELLAPASIDSFVPFWSQHSMHTVTLVVTMLDMVMLPRARPKSFVPGLSLMTFFVLAYSFMCVESYVRGEYIYPVFKFFDGFKMSVLMFYVLIEHLFYYFGQFIVYDLIWARYWKESIQKL
ncbi:unnamed protein product [Chilo suppressalis]|uniref:Androgen-dependent TFPI-regulating protein n=1 Tax=Chilo suppressalis TaxID=168631 RepID=A0ABN8BDC8_CHISP|nr:hypothetical protein evm_012573 [Chilo suppressalis]CAH0406877.1 unnamed protein product [Chilo suppressalis]